MTSTPVPLLFEALLTLIIHPSRESLCQSSRGELCDEVYKDLSLDRRPRLIFDAVWVQLRRLFHCPTSGFQVLDDASSAR